MAGPCQIRTPLFQHSQEMTVHVVGYVPGEMTVHVVGYVPGEMTVHVERE